MQSKETTDNQTNQRESSQDKLNKVVELYHTVGKFAPPGDKSFKRDFNKNFDKPNPD